MEQGTLFRGGLIVLIVLIISALILGAYQSPVFAVLATQFGLPLNFSQSPVTKALLDHAAVSIICGVALWNYRAVISFIRRSVQPTDDLITHNWYVYRYSKTRGQIVPMKEIWTIKRNLSSTYEVKVRSLQKDLSSKICGNVVYNERDRFGVLLRGRDHKQQSLVSFCPLIPYGRDTRMLGLGSGDDADYVLSARIYLASRTQLSDAYAFELLDDASKELRNSGSDQLIQLTKELMLDVLKKHPLPAAEMQKPASQGTQAGGKGTAEGAFASG